MSDRAPFIRVRGLVRRYPGVIALAGCDLDIGFGEVIGLVGKNGAGKSTLIRILAGAETADEGSVSVDGVTLGATHGPAVAHALGLAFMHQELANAPGLSVAENVALGSPFPRRLGVFVDNARLEERVREALAKLKLDIDPRMPVDGLTMVQKRMVMIARALYHNARLLVLDEPSTSLTETEIAHLHRVVAQMRASGRSVVYVSHRLREIVNITDRVVVMQDGRVTLEKPTAAMSEAEIVAAIAAGARNQPATQNQSARPLAKTGNVVLRVRDLSRPPSVRNVSFDLRSGEILGIAGLVGSGRTELVRLIAGADRPSGGSVELDNRIVPSGSPRKAVKAGIVLLPEDRRHQGLVLSMSVSENVTLASLDRHRSSILPFIRRSSERAATVDLIRRLSIRTPGPEQEVRRLSGGNQQKTVLAKWLSRDGRVFIFDEPTQGVDVHGKDEIFALIHEVVAGGKSAIVISSDFSELVSLCDRVIVLREGNIAGALDGEAIDEPTMVRLAYVGSQTRSGGVEGRRT